MEVFWSEGKPLSTWPVNLKKSSKKTHASNKSDYFFSLNCTFGSFKLFPSTKIDSWPFLKLQKKEFGQEKFREIDLFDFPEFFWPGLF